MSVNTSKTAGKEKTNVKLPVIIAAGVVLVIGLGLYGHKVFSPTANVENELTDKQDAFMQKVAKEAGPSADLSKLNQADRDALARSVSGSRYSPEEVLKLYIAHHTIH